MANGTRDIECLGGPMDGKTMPVPDSCGDNACLLHMDAENLPHFYVTIPRDGQDKLVYAGHSDPRCVTRILRTVDPETADILDAQLDEVEDDDVNND